MKLAVSDTAPLISLEKISDGFAFIRRLYDRILIPQAVLDEVTFGYDRPERYLSHYGIDDLVMVQTIFATVSFPEIDRLHPGEVQAIQLALDQKLPLLIEEATGRRAARAAGLTISGIAGQVIKAHRQRLVSAQRARTLLNDLLEHRRINERIHEHLTSTLRPMP